MTIAVEVWREYRQSKDEKLRQELILAYLPLVKYLAGRLAVKLPPIISQEDLESYGVFGLLEAVEKYNPDLGTSFKSYAYNRIRGAIIDEVRKLNWLPRTMWQKLQVLYNTKENLLKESGYVSSEALAEAMGITLPELHKLTGQVKFLTQFSLDEILPTTEGDQLRMRDMIQDQCSPDPLKILEKKESRQLLIKAIEELPEKDRIILALYYEEGLTLKEIGRVLKVSESRVCQLHARTIGRLRNKLGQPDNRE